MLVHLSDIVLGGEGVGDALFEFALVGTVIEQYGVGTMAIAPSSASLLEISLDAIRTVDMYYQSHVGLVDTHTEGIGSYHHAGLSFLPGLLTLVFHARVKTGMVEGGGDA